MSLSFYVEQITQSFDPQGVLIELRLRVARGEQKAIMEAMETIRRTSSLDPLVRFWFERLPAEERLKLLADAVTERLNPDQPDGP